MKIAMIGHKTVPSRDGGIEVVVTELVSRMVENGHEVDCYNRCEDIRNIRKLPKEYAGAKMIWVPTFRRQSLNAIVYAVLATIIACCKRYDVIHIHAEGPAVMSFLPRLLGIPVVVTIHGLDWQRAKWGGFATKFLKFGERCAVKFADALIVLSRENMRYFYDQYRRDTVYINNGIEEKTYREPKEILERWGLKRDGYILFLARIVPEKGLHYLLKAFKSVKTDKKLVIAGKLIQGNQYCDEIVRMASEDPRVICTDFVTGRTLEELFSNCYIYCLPSDIEGMAMSFLEALSYGARCLVSDIPENMEVAENFARYFKKSDVQVLTAQLTEMLQDNGNYDRAAQRQYISDHYSWDLVTAQTLRLYDCAAAGRKRGIMNRLRERKYRLKEMPALLKEHPEMCTLPYRQQCRAYVLLRAVERLEKRCFRSASKILYAFYSNEHIDEQEISWFDRYRSEIQMVHSELDVLFHGVPRKNSK